ncbi:MAG: Holliday junction branch migration DNA helicase RuvB [Candidatus Caenarcaniphilales bacterium]|nr:Holliday junction branch migration DNA helicase RuvB [Candidatus Caenarcaniphilales bacterium]
MVPIEPSKIPIDQSPEVKQGDLEFKEKTKSSKVSSQLLSEENKFEQSLRPANLSEYIGQERLKQILKIGIEAAIKRGDRASVGHILLYGPPGLGKTSCAFLLAKLIGSNAHIFSAPSLDKPKDIVGILMSLQEGDVLFVDEIHRLNKVTEELLYTAMEDFCLDLSTGKGVSARVTRLPIPKFVLVGATTKLGNIASPLRDRFTHVHRMDFYSNDELAQIAIRSSNILEFKLSTEAATVIASRSRGTPRITNRLCRLVRDYMSHKDSPVATEDIAIEALNLFQIDHNGLDHTDRALLKALIENYGGGPAGLETLAVTLGEDSKTIEDHYEPYLIQSGLLERTSKGRKVTPKAYKLFNLTSHQTAKVNQINFL